MTSYVSVALSIAKAVGLQGTSSLRRLMDIVMMLDAFVILAPSPLIFFLKTPLYDEETFVRFATCSGKSTHAPGIPPAHLCVVNDSERLFLQ